MARKVGTLERQAREQALGINRPPKEAPRFIEGPGIFDNGILEAVRVRGYYPPTRKFYDATNRVESISWTDSVEQAAVQCTMVFNDTDGQASAVLNRLGMIWFVEVKGPSGKFRERLRVTAWTATITDDNTVEIIAYDSLLFLQIAKGASFLYRADKDHPKGWTSSEVALDIIRRYKIPVAYTRPVTRQKGKTYRKEGKLVHTKGQKAKTTGRMRIVRTTYRFPYFHERSTSLYEVLAGAYSIDRKHTNRHYYMLSVGGRLAIIRKPSAKRILALTADQIRTFSFERDLTNSFASVLIPLGADRNGKGKRQGRSYQSYPREKVQRGEGVKFYQREHEKGPGLAEVHANQQAALTFLFGNLPISRKLRNVHDRAHFYKEAQKTIDALSRSVKTITLTCEGNVMVKQGDRIQARVPVSEAQTIKRDLFVKTVTHSMAPGDYSMELELVWREKDVDLSVEVPTEDLHRSTSAGSETESPKGNAAVRGSYNRPQIEELLIANGWPSSQTTHIMAAIAMAESGGNPKAANPSSTARGLFQIEYNVNGITEQCALEPNCAARSALKIYKGAGGFSPWETFTTGAYLKFM